MIQVKIIEDCPKLGLKRGEEYFGYRPALATDIIVLAETIDHKPIKKILPYGVVAYLIGNSWYRLVDDKPIPITID